MRVARCVYPKSRFKRVEQFLLVSQDAFNDVLVRAPLCYSHIEDAEAALWSNPLGQQVAREMGFRMRGREPVRDLGRVSM